MKNKRFRILFIMLLLTVIAFPACAEAVGNKVMIDLTPIVQAAVQALIGLLATIITAKVIPWIKAKTTVQQQQALAAAARMAVYAAEQVYGSGCGQEKLAYAQRWLLSRGYDLDFAAIEAAVREMNVDSQ